MLKALRSRPTDIWTLDEVLTACQWDDQAYVAGSGLALAEHGLVDIETTKSTIWSLGAEGITANEQGLLEQRIWDLWYQSLATVWWPTDWGPTVLSAARAVRVGSVRTPLTLKVLRGCSTRSARSRVRSLASPPTRDMLI